jgi:threonine/homoserine/homoserine lactone efflux protein
MGDAIGQSLSLAIGVALSPMPIIAVTLLLVTARARANGSAFVLGWVLGLAVAGAIVLAVAGPADAAGDEGPATWVDVLKIALGALLVLVAIRQWRSRPGNEAQGESPKWMAAIEGFTPVKALGTGALLAGANPKNTPLVVGAAAAIAQTGISGAQQAIAYAVFAIIGTIGVGVPLVLYFTMGQRSREILKRMRDWMSHNNVTIMAVLCLVIGTKLVGDGITGF